ncbi:MAG: DUF4340 domain-containing protein [Deltaproteobacteria bacterium]
MRNYIAKFKVTAAAALILIGLGAYIYLFEMRGADSPSRPPERVFADVAPQDIIGVEFRFPARSIECRKEGGVWLVYSEDGGFRADSGVVLALAAEALNIEISKIASENPADLPLYGLDSPRLEVSIKTAAAEYSLLVGIQSPVTSGVYVKDGGDVRTLIAPSASVEKLLAVSVPQLRSKRPLSLNEAKIGKIRVMPSQYPSFVLERVADSWTAADAPEGVVIDGVRVAGFIKTLANLEVLDFSEQKPLSSYGLDKPSTEIEIFEDEKSVRILFGGRAESGGYYMKLAGSGAVYRVSDAVYYEIPDGLDDFTLKRLLELISSSVQGLEIKTGGETIALIKEGSDWKFPSGRADSRPSRLKILELLEEMENLYGEGYLSELPKDLSPFGLDEPQIHITVAEAGDKRTTLLFGARRDEKVFVMIQGRRVIYRVSDRILALIPASAKDLEAR